MQKPHNTIDRELQALHLLGLLRQDESLNGSGWQYQLAESVDKHALRMLISRIVSTQDVGDKEESGPLFLVTDKAGNGSVPR